MTYTDWSIVTALTLAMVMGALFLALRAPKTSEFWAWLIAAGLGLAAFLTAGNELRNVARDQPRKSQIMLLLPPEPPTVTFGKGDCAVTVPADAKVLRALRDLGIESWVVACEQTRPRVRAACPFGAKCT